MEKGPICVQHHEYPELKMSIAVGSTGVLFFRRETQNDGVAEPGAGGVTYHPVLPCLPFLASHTGNPRLHKEVTSYHDCSWQTAASHCVRLINKCMTHKTEQQRFTQRWICPLRTCRALTYSSDVLGSAGSKETIWSTAVYDIYVETFSGTAAWQTQLVLNKEMLIIYRCITNKSSWHSNSEFLEQVKVVVTPVNPTWQHSNK